MNHFQTRFTTQKKISLENFQRWFLTQAAKQTWYLSTLLPEISWKQTNPLNLAEEINTLEPSKTLGENNGTCSDFPPAHQGVKNKGPMDQTHEEWCYCSSVGCKPPPKQAQALPRAVPCCRRSVPSHPTHPSSKAQHCTKLSRRLQPLGSISGISEAKFTYRWNKAALTCLHLWNLINFSVDSFVQLPS